MKQFFTTFIFLLFVITISYCQKYEYEVSLKPIDIPNLGGLQSYVVGTHDGEWLIIGGRLDGLHMRQPFAAFDEDGMNNHIIVVNPVTKKVWKTSISVLPSNIKEQFSSTNIQFYQEGDFLLMAGGYGYSTSQDEHITFPYLTIVDIPNMIEAIKNEATIHNFIKQEKSELFETSGGRLEKIGAVFYLVGGHKFTGRYNPMGPLHGPGFVQEYTNEIRRFSIKIEDKIEIVHLPAIHDEIHLRRRDYNLLPQVKNGKEELIIFSGVFQPTVDLPFLYPVVIDGNSYHPVENYIQYYNHYHCAALPIYNKGEDEMHNLFFGGISQFYDEKGIIVQDDEVPFVNTIADVSRTSNGVFKEQKLSNNMPDLLGAGSEFIIMEHAPLYKDGVIDGDEICKKPVPVGYIYGGIKSSLPNIFFTNTGKESNASSTIYQVLIRKIKKKEFKTFDNKAINLLIYPYPIDNAFRIAFDMDTLEDVEISVFNPDGKVIKTKKFFKKELQVGRNILLLEDFELDFGTYLYRVLIGEKPFLQKVRMTE
ncbi:MAG: T9SS C-terminal target domain-containing protein [Saprospiraceae bacterium]